jgi:hypothetical protein
MLGCRAGSERPVYIEDFYVAGQWNDIDLLRSQLNGAAAFHFFRVVSLPGVPLFSQ